MLSGGCGVNLMEMRSNGRINCVSAGCLSYVNLSGGLWDASFLFRALSHIGAHMLRARTSYGVEIH